MEQEWRRANNKKIIEFKKEMGNVGKDMRLQALHERLEVFENDITDRARRIKGLKEDQESAINWKFLEHCQGDDREEAKKIRNHIESLLKSSTTSSEITDEMIEQARHYPLENLIEVKRKMAKCPFHDDRHPSMGIKNNRFHCFACGAKGDVIDFVMRRDGLTFREAIACLT